MVIVRWKEDCIPRMNLGKEEKYELSGEYEQTFSALVFCLLYLHMNTSTHVVKFRHGCFHVTFSLIFYVGISSIFLELMVHILVYVLSNQLMSVLVLLDCISGKLTLRRLYKDSLIVPLCLLSYQTLSILVF